MLVDIWTTRALGGRVGEGGDNCVETDLHQSTSPKLNAFLKQDHGLSLAFLGRKPVWMHRTAILARVFDCTPEIFDSVSTLASLGAMVQVRLTNQAFEN